jgi:iron complex outermembrane recepter protein
VLPNATSGTKTDTPIMETPMNVQLISKQVLKDQQVISLDKALRNVSGVTVAKNTVGGGNNTYLRGFETDTQFRNGVRFDSTNFGNNQEFANVESVEVLKGPAAILYGRVEPGGMVNIVTKQPLATPYYALNQQFGSYDLYRTSIDATGPLTKDDTLLYRVNASFRSNNSFRDLVKDEDVFFAPIVKWNIGPRTQATPEMEYNRSLSSQDNQFLPLVNNKIIPLPPSRNLGERNPKETENIFVGFNWPHQFNDDWSIKHQMIYKNRDVNLGVGTPFVGRTSITGPDDLPLPLPKGQIGRDIHNERNINDTYATILDLTGHFNTWGLEHTLLFGGDYYRFEDISRQSTNFNPSIIDFNNPVHPGPGIEETPFNFQEAANTDNYGLYLQDQIKLPYNLHVMGGFRYQYVHTAFADTNGTSSIQTDDAVTPRVGMLWQPQNWLSLYGNYTENFGSGTVGGVSFAGKGLVKPLPFERAQQWEVGAKAEFFGGRLRATLAYFDLTKQNVAAIDRRFPSTACNGGSCLVAIGEVRSRGPELDIQGEILPGWNVIATYANQDVSVTKSSGDPFGEGAFEVGNRLEFVPRNIGSVWTSYEVQDGDLKGF